MTEQDAADVVQQLTFGTHCECVYSIDMATGTTTTVSELNSISFHTFDNDDRLQLGSVVLAPGTFPDNFVGQFLSGGTLTFDMLEAQGVLSREQVRASLQDMADKDIYPQLPFSWPVTVAGEPTLAKHLFLKRVHLGHCRGLLLIQSSNGPGDREDEGQMVPSDDAINLLRSEVQVLQLIAQHPRHPNIIKYHGCRVRRGFVTGIVLDRANGPDLFKHMTVEGGTVDKTAFMSAMRSAIHHLHSVVGVAHNDLNPNNIMVVDGRPVLIDFGSARPLGSPMGSSRGTPGWDPNSLQVPDPTSVQYSESNAVPPTPPLYAFMKRVCQPDTGFASSLSDLGSRRP